MKAHVARLAIVMSLVATAPARHLRANVAAVGPGFVLGTVASITSDPAEVISGKQSIKGSYSGSLNNSVILATDASVFSLAPNRPLRVTFQYRVLTTSTSFVVNFFSTNQSNTAGAGGISPQTFGGSAGASGTFSAVRTLGNFSDYRVFWQINAPGGTIIIDDIQIVQDDTNQVVAAEDGEGPRINPGPLNFQVLDSQTIPPTGTRAPEYSAMHGLSARDLDGDGNPEIIVTMTSGTNQIAQTPIILSTLPTLSDITASTFPAGAPKLHDSFMNFFVDLDGDGLKDLVFADAGLDAPSFAGKGFSVALSTGRGTYRDVSSLVPAAQQLTRGDVTAADLDGNGRSVILAPDQSGSNPVLLRWTGGGFSVQQNWIDQSLWAPPTRLRGHGWVGFADVDGDGKEDLIVTGNPGTPSFRILFGSTGPFTANTLVQLPDGPFGHAPSPPSVSTPLVQGADVSRVVVADFNNDGRPDLIGFEEQQVQVLPGAITDPNVPGYSDLLQNGGHYYGNTGLQVLLNNGGRKFTDISAASTAQILGTWRLYVTAVAVDVNNDGFLDVVATFLTKQYGSQPPGLLGTTFFLNDGTGAFQVVDGSQLLPQATTNPASNQTWSLGSFVATSITPTRTEGVIVNPVHAGTGALDVYRIAANTSIGTGPNFIDPATLGVPGFNEFYYLRHYPDAAAAVQAGQFKSGLDHYLAVGAAKGYRKSAPTNANP